MANQFKFTGFIEKIFDIKTGTSNGKDWKAVEFIVRETGGEYPQSAKFQLFGEEKVDKFLKYNNELDEVEVSFNFKCKETAKGWFTSIDAWSVKNSDYAKKEHESHKNAVIDENITNDEIDESLPF